MPKINQEEYELLKGLDDEYKWIARDDDLSVYDDKPVKVHSVIPCWDLRTTKNEWQIINRSLFHFIQWEDEEPYNIAELIKEYESEETEVKTLESIREEIWDEMLRLEDKRKDQWADIKYQTLREVLQKLGHLDEPEILSQELPVIPKFVAEWIEEMKQDERPLYSVMSNLMNKTNHEWAVWKSANKNFSEIVAQAWLDGFTVEKEQKYYARIKGWENVTTGSEAFNWVYFKEKDTVGISKAVENKYQAVSFTKNDWNNLGINEHNADFVLVEELEE